MSIGPLYNTGFAAGRNSAADEIERLTRERDVTVLERGAARAFPEPDFEKAARLLRDGGMTLDAISASNMRHVVEGVGKIASAALVYQQISAQSKEKA